MLIETGQSPTAGTYKKFVRNGSEQTKGEKAEGKHVSGRRKKKSDFSKIKRGTRDLDKKDVIVYIPVVVNRGHGLSMYFFFDAFRDLSKRKKKTMSEP